MILYKYKIFCLTDSKFVTFEDFRPGDLPLPTTCPDDSSHTCDADSVSIVETVNTETQKVSLEVPKTSGGIQKVSVYEPEGDAATIVSHNYADKCSWYQHSTQVIYGLLTNTTGNVFADPNGKEHWIDLEHGRLYGEDDILARCNNKYKVKVYVSGVLQTSGYTVDYDAGTVTFDSPVSGPVRASYCYAAGSYYSIRPKEGKILAIKATEIQFSINTVMECPFVFEPWFVGHPIYGTMPIPGKKLVYKNAKDFISSANQGQGFVPKWNELMYDVMVFPFLYARPKSLKYSDFIEIRVYTEQHCRVAGEYATGTFYVTIDDETVPNEGEETVSETAESLQLQVNQRAITKPFEYTFTKEYVTDEIINLFNIPANARVLEVTVAQGPLAIDSGETGSFTIGHGAASGVDADHEIYGNFLYLNTAPTRFCNIGFGIKYPVVVPLTMKITNDTLAWSGLKVTGWVTYLQE